MAGTESRRSLLDEEAFAKLIAPHERFGGAKPAEQIGDFAVLKNALRSERTRSGNQFQILGVQNPVAMKRFRLAGVKHREDNSAIANQRMSSAPPAWSSVRCPDNPACPT